MRKVLICLFELPAIALVSIPVIVFSVSRAGRGIAWETPVRIILGQITAPIAIVFWAIALIYICL
jgi:hypothetical protein